MFTKIYGMAKTDSTTMNIQKIPNILTKHIRESLENSKMRWQVYQLLNSLQPEVYSYVKDKNKGDKTAKGIKRNVMKKDIKHTDIICIQTLPNTELNFSSKLYKIFVKSYVIA